MKIAAPVGHSLSANPVTPPSTPRTPLHCASFRCTSVGKSRPGNPVRLSPRTPITLPSTNVFVHQVEALKQELDEAKEKQKQVMQEVEELAAILKAKAEQANQPLSEAQRVDHPRLSSPVKSDGGVVICMTPRSGFEREGRPRGIGALKWNCLRKRVRPQCLEEVHPKQYHSGMPPSPIGTPSYPVCTPSNASRLGTPVRLGTPRVTPPATPEHRTLIVTQNDDLTACSHSPLVSPRGTPSSPARLVTPQGCIGVKSPGAVAHGTLAAKVSPPVLLGNQCNQHGLGRAHLCAKGDQPDRGHGRTLAVTVVAPGAGTRYNRAAYQALGKSDQFVVTIKGHGGARYDRYPETWDEGAPAPNLETFAKDLLEKEGIVENSDCLIVGSRGGQVVLPALWKARGPEVPPAVVINGGCAMSFPSDVQWPETAVTFLLIGGQDYFKGRYDIQQYFEDTIKRVPSANATTAILLVNEMGHMPQGPLLDAVLARMIWAIMLWTSPHNVPIGDFGTIVEALRNGGWSGQLAFKTGIGQQAWQAMSFP